MSNEQYEKRIADLEKKLALLSGLGGSNNLSDRRAKKMMDPSSSSSESEGDTSKPKRVFAPDFLGEDNKPKPAPRKRTTNNNAETRYIYKHLTEEQKMNVKNAYAQAPGKTKAQKIQHVAMQTGYTKYMINKIITGI